MARAAKNAVTKSSGTSLALVDQELAAEAVALRNQISAPASNKLKLEVAGSFTLPDGGDLGDEIQIVVVDFMNRNFWYSQKYNPNNIVPPDCYAMGKDRNTMAPENDSPSMQSDACATCALNVFGSGDNGKSKACQNRYWLACLIVDPDNPDAHNEPDAPLYVLDLSPSNLQSFNGAVTGVARAMGGPPIKAILTARAQSAGNFAKVLFGASPIPNPDYALHLARRAEAQDMLTRRPDFSGLAALAAAPKSRQPARRQAGGRR